MKYSLGGVGYISPLHPPPLKKSAFPAISHNNFVTSMCICLDDRQTSLIEIIAVFLAMIIVLYIKNNYANIQRSSQ
jgi:hypothetical protein